MQPFRRMKRNLYQFFVTMICMISVLFILNMMNYLHKLYIIDYYENEALDRNTIYFSVHPAESMDLRFIMDKNIMEDATLLLHEKNTGVYYKVLYSAGDMDIFHGNYFSKNDFIAGLKKSVIGSKVILDNDDRNISIGNHDYKVIGRFDETINETMNLSVFFTNGNLNNIYVDSVFALASKSKSNISNSFQKVKTEFEQRGYIITEIKYNKIQYKDFIHYHSQLLIVIMGLSILICITNTTSMFFWYLGKKNTIRVWNLLGFKHIKFHVLLSYIKLYIVAYGIGFLSYIIVWRYDLYSYMVLAWGSIIILLQLLILLLPYVIFMRSNA